ncbi:hypothetical protein [Halorientalis pallida]|uniref:Uncharacterized protein n=1 Tax=Halorientalis pallida TaxID=2479928 RepID=A0A498KYL5_9EURY|nr:hypothetical protein [Halorientalis pallida]RXK48032.1 hypothetical protein EAF64_15500 [Halorientalis pallida]
MSVLIDLLMLVFFLTLLPKPRCRLYQQGIILGLTALVAAAFAVIPYIKPIVDLTKVSLQSTAVTWFIRISFLVPRVGERILSNDLGVERLRRAMRSSFENDMLEFRRKIRRLTVRQIEPDETTPQKEELLASIRQSRDRIRRRHTIGELIVGVSVGIIALFISILNVWAGIGFFIGIYTIFLPVSVYMRSMVVDSLAYSVNMPDADSKLHPRKPGMSTLVFMDQWNRMLMNEERHIHKMIVVSFIRGEFKEGTEMGIELLGRVVSGEMTLEGAFDEMVTEELGEDTMESRWIRRVMKQYFGI